MKDDKRPAEVGIISLILPLYIPTLCIMFGYGMIVPVLPLFARYLGAGVGMGVIAMPLALLLRIRMNIFSEKNSHFREPVTYHLDANLIRWVREDGSESSWRWDKMENVERHENYILLFPTGNAFLYVPNDAFESEEARDFFEARLEEIENR